ncbi:MAG: ATP-binding protein [Lachnospiraceae bacterium]
MKTREAFEQIRNRKNNKFSLRLRLLAMVSGEICTSILLAYGLSVVLEKVFPYTNEIPLLLRLVVLGLLVGFVVTSLLLKWVLEPLLHLREAMEKVADGDFTVRITKKSSLKEIQEVYSGFNLMTHELASTEMIQKDFISNVSHELKTPVAAIEGYSMLLQDCENLSEEQKGYVGKILFNTNRLSTLFGNMLLLTKLENQSIETNQTWYRLDEQIRESIVALEPVWVKKDIDFDVDLEDIMYFGNENLLRHVWDNLISNAIKFSPQKGLVRIRLIRENEKIVFTVKDNGIGISEEDKKHIFDKFYQADSSHKQEGHGLGLPLVKRILMITGGEIKADSGESGGSTFTVILND